MYLGCKEKLMKILYTTVLLTLITSASLAQAGKTQKDSTRYYDHGSITLGYSNQSFDNLNARLIKYFPKSIPHNVFNVGFGGKTAFNQLLMQGGFQLGLGSNSSAGKGYTNAVLMGFDLDGGVFLTQPGAVRIYPFVGLSADAAIVSAKIRTDNIAFDSVLSNPVTRENIKPVTMSNFFVSWKGGLGIDFGNRATPKRPYTFGLKFGYKQSFNKGTWSMSDDSNLVNAPNDQLKQWFASIVFYGPTSKAAKSKRWRSY